MGTIILRVATFHHECLKWLLDRGPATWTDLLASKNFSSYPHIFLQVGIYARARARARRARLQDIISAWSKSEGNFDFESIDSWPQN